MQDDNGGILKLTRENLASGASLERLRDEFARHGKHLTAAGFALRSEPEIEACWRAFLDQRPPDADEVWVFGYGSLMWNPAIHFVEASNARIEGYHRSFCLLSIVGRGSPERPGLMLGLDDGGACAGRAYRLHDEAVESEVAILWRREMLSNAYRPVWMTIDVGARQVSGFTFVVSRTCSRYRPGLKLSEQAELIRNGRGHLGSCLEYLENTAEHLEELGLEDQTVRRLMQLARPA